MPYNNTPITPSKEITGTVALPLARVKKIIATDDDVSNCSNNAAFVITVAAEMFLQHLVEQSYNIVKSERKPRKNVQYRDVANAVARVENLEFLTDVVPKTTTYKQHKQKQRQQQEQPQQPSNADEALAEGSKPVHQTPFTQMDMSKKTKQRDPGPDASFFLSRGQIKQDQVRSDGTIVGDIMPPGTHMAPPPSSGPTEIIDDQAMNGAKNENVDAMDIDAAEAVESRPATGRESTPPQRNDRTSFLSPEGQNEDIEREKEDNEKMEGV